jgi:hypothetical protein
MPRTVCHLRVLGVTCTPNGAFFAIVDDGDLAGGSHRALRHAAGEAQDLDQ